MSTKRHFAGRLPCTKPAISTCALERESTIHKAQLEVELPIYRDLWSRVYELERTLNEVQVQAILAG